jgi:citrate synthase
MGQAGNFLFMLSGDRPTSSRARALDAVWVLHADHELNASTFAARVAASTLADLHSAVLAALCALKGRLHGGAAEGVMAMIEAAGEPANAAAYVREAVAARQRIMGFGHRIYRQGDPRAAWLRRMAEDLAGETGDRRRFDITRAIEREVAERTGLLPNIDLYSASVYAYLGIPPALFTSMFAVSRVAGWIAHILEQYDNNRLIRPLAEYVGPSPRPYIPLSER